MINRNLSINILLIYNPGRPIIPAAAVNRKIASPASPIPAPFHHSVMGVGSSLCCGQSFQLCECSGRVAQGGIEL